MAHFTLPFRRVSSDSKLRKTGVDFSLFDVSIDRNEASRIDKYRIGSTSATALYPAMLKDAGNPIESVAKVGLS